MTRNLVRSLVLLVAAGTLALVVGGCGGSDSEEGVPSELAGTYVTTLAASDLPANAPPELEAGRWELAIGALEGADKGSFLAINHPTEGTLEEPELTVDGDVTDEVLAEAKRIADEILSNSVIEDVVGIEVVE